MEGGLIVAGSGSRQGLKEEEGWARLLWDMEGGQKDRKVKVIKKLKINSKEMGVSKKRLEKKVEGSNGKNKKTGTN